MNGIDCSTRLTPQSAEALKAAGIEAVGRYLGYKLGWCKSLTPDEVKAIHDAGLSLFLIWESNPTYAGYFNYQRGINDAQLALNEAQFLGVPEGSTIYFTVDYDAQPGDMGFIAMYFSGIRDALQGKYLIGVYGSYFVMNAVKADKYFQTYAWSRGEVFPAHIYQHKNDVTLQGIAVDLDLVNEDAGLWGKESIMKDLVIYADGDTGAALLLSYKLGCPMIMKDFANNVTAENKHWIGFHGENGNGNFYYAGSDRIETAKLGL